MADRPMDGGSSLFGELRRYARTSGAVGGIAARVAGAKVFGIKTDKAWRTRKTSRASSAG